MADQYAVQTAACTVYLATGAVTLLYKGAVLPATSDLAKGEAKRLLDGGFVAKHEPDEATDPEPVAMAAGDDPAGFTAEQVLTHLTGADEAERTRVLEAETGGKARKGVLAFEAPAPS